MEKKPDRIKKAFEVTGIISNMHSQINICSRRETPKAGNGLQLSLFPIPGSTWPTNIAFSASVEGFVIEMKLAAPVPEDNTVSLKA